MKQRRISPNAKCRILGCYSHIPYWGAYPGLPQSHCPRCGMITGYASIGCSDFTEPLYPEGDWLYRVIEWYRSLLERK